MYFVGDVASEKHTHTECRQSAYVSGCVCVFWSFSSLSSVCAHVIDCVYGTNFSYLIYMHAVVVPMQTRTLKTAYSKIFAKHIHTPYKDTNDSWTKRKKIVVQIGYGGVWSDSACAPIIPIIRYVERGFFEFDFWPNDRKAHSTRTAFRISSIPNRPLQRQHMCASSGFCAKIQSMQCKWKMFSSLCRSAI